MMNNKVFVGVILVLLIFSWGSCAFAISWTQYKGTKIAVIAQENPETRAIRKQIPEFEKLTGIKVDYATLPQRGLRDKLIPELSAGAGLYEVIWVDLTDIAMYSQAGWILPLDDFISSSTLSDPNVMALDDYTKVAINGLILNGKTWGLPVVVDTSCLYYRTDLFSAYGLTPPGTWDSLLETAKKLTLDTDGDGKIDLYGVTLRGAPGMGGMLVFNWAGVFESYGGIFFDKNWKPGIDTPAGIKATYWYKEISKFAPPGISEYTWYDVLTTFSQGKAAMCPDCFGFCPTIGNPETSTVADKFDASTWPSGPAGIYPQYWSAGMGLEKKAKHPEAGWLFLQWVVGPEPSIERLLWGSSTGPARRSVLYHPQSKEKRGAPSDEFIRLVVRTLDIADPDYRPRISEWAQVGRSLATSLSEAIVGTKSVEDALKSASKEIYEIMESAGYYD